MKFKLLYLIPLFTMCNNNSQDTSETITKDTISQQITLLKSDTQNLSKITTDNLKTSEIINSVYDKNLIFGAWASSPNGEPTCDFSINKEIFLYCDYDGDGSRFYKIINDSIYINMVEEIVRGKIEKVNEDILIIHWENTSEPDTSYRFKN